MNKKIKELFYAFILCTALIITFAGKEVQAAAKAPSCSKNQIIYCYRNDLGGNHPAKTYGYSDLETSSLEIKNLTSKAVISNVKISNSKIKTNVINYGSNAGIGFGVKSWKAGVKDGEKAKITFTVKQNGKKYNLSSVLTFKKSKTPLASLKIGNKEYASVFKGAAKKGINFPKSKFKISYKAASAYRVVEITARLKNRSDKKLKNGMTVNGKDIEYIMIKYNERKLPADSGYSTLYLYSWDFID